MIKLIYMKKRILSVFLIFAICLALVPLMSGCKASLNYYLNEAGDGYVFGASGFSYKLEGELEIPEYYGEGEDRLPVKEIASEGFSGTSLTKVIIPKTVEKIGSAAFSYNNYLKEIVFAEGINLKETGWGAYGYCVSLEKITLPKSVTHISGLSFFGCSSLAEINIDEGVTGIGKEAFSNCTALKSVNLPSTLTTIGDMAFYFSGLESVIIPDGVHDIKEPALNEDGTEQKNDKGETVYNLTRGVGRAAFHSCTSLKTAAFGAGMQTIYSGTFGYCTALEKLYIPSSVKKIEGAEYSGNKVAIGHAFHNDKALAEIYFGGSEEEWEQLKKNTENTFIGANGANYDNSAIFNAKIFFNALSLS